MSNILFQGQVLLFLLLLGRSQFLGYILTNKDYVKKIDECINRSLRNISKIHEKDEILKSKQDTMKDIGEKIKQSRRSIIELDKKSDAEVSIMAKKEILAQIDETIQKSRQSI